MKLHRLAAAIGAVLLVTSACGSSSVSGQRSAASPTSDEATQAYVALIRAYWGDLHIADVTMDGADVDAKACLGEMSPTSPSDVHVVQPQICLAYAMATLAANQKFLAGLDTVQAPAKFAADDRVFRTDIPKAISDLKTLVAACDGPNRQPIIDAMWTFAKDMIPEVTNALDDVDPSVTHLDPSATG
jgi:hypothetical protein